MRKRRSSNRCTSSVEYLVMKRNQALAIRNVIKKYFNRIAKQIKKIEIEKTNGLSAILFNYFCFQIER